MPSNASVLVQLIKRAEQDNDIETLERLLRDGFELAEESPEPFSPRLAMREDFRTEYLSGEPEGSRAVNWLNRIARAKRRVQFNLKIAGAFEGRVLVEEGDSWTQYPVLLDDIVDHLNTESDIAIFSTGAAGDIVANMAAQKEYLPAIRATNAQGLLLSGGGNDLLGDGALARVLLQYDEHKPVADLIDYPALERSVQDILHHYRTILSDVQNEFPGIKVFGHGYDLPFPQNGGKWLGTPFAEKGIPADVGRNVLQIIIDTFNEHLITLAQSANNFVFTDLRGVVDRGANSWFDELHPKNAGYERAANAILDTIDQHIEARAAGGFGVESLTAASKVVVLDPGHGGTTPPPKVGGSRWNNAVGPNGTLEKTLTLDVARRTKSILEARGFAVHLTRSSDVNLGLSARAAVAKSRNAPVFVSIHFNASTGHNAQGTETFVHTLSGSASKDLCRAVQAEMVTALGLRDRNALHPGGIKKAGFSVLKPASHASATAAVLHEVSFLDRADEEQRLQKVSYLKKIATALADGIETYLSPGLESFNRLVEADEIGDAIEAEAFDRGVSVAHYLSGANQQDGLDEVHTGTVENALFRRLQSGGHLIANADETNIERAEASASEASSDWLYDMARSLAARHDASTYHGGDNDFDRNDIDEFSTVDIGPSPDFDAFGVDIERNVEQLRGLFAGVERAAFDYRAFEAFIGSLGLRYFAPAEFLYLGGGNASGLCAGKNQLPPRHLWSNLANSAKMLDEIRHRLGAPVRITSCYRSTAYNDCVDGRPRSLHLEFNAIDWTCSTGRPRNWASVAKAVRATSTAFRGGVGIYTAKNFVHIDTRGNNANWGS